MDYFVNYIENEQHYHEVLLMANKVKSSLWIGTADIKDLFVKDKTRSFSFLELLSRAIERKINVRLLHAKEPGPIFRKDFDKFPNLAKSLERAICPRVHFKILIFDLKVAYIGSANLTGAGLGMKSPDKRNFEAGVLSNSPKLVDKAIDQFDLVWQGVHCKTCERKDYCGDRIDK